LSVIGILGVFIIFRVLGRYFKPTIVALKHVKVCANAHYLVMSVKSLAAEQLNIVASHIRGAPLKVGWVIYRSNFWVKGFVARR